MIGLRHQSPSALFPIAGATGGRLWQGALLVTALYLLVLAAGWTINIPAGHEGILRIAPAETQPGALEIVEVAAGSPAAMAGLKTGDLLLAMNGFTMMEGEAVHQSLHERRAGGALRLRVQRLETDGAAPRYGAPEDLTLTLVSQLAVPSVVIDYLMASVVGLLILLVALVVARQSRDRRPARLLMLFAGCFAFLVLMDTMHWALPSAAIANMADIASFVMLVVGCAALLHLFLAFPVPHPMVRRLEQLRLPGLPGLSGTLLLYVAPMTVPAALLLGVVQDFSWLTIDVLLLLALALAALLRGYWRSPTPLVHAQVKWVTLGFLIFVVAFVLKWIVPSTTEGRVEVLPAGIFLAALALFPLAMGFAILRYRLWDIDLLINRALVYGGLTGLLALVYLASVVVLQEVFQAVAGQESNLAIVISTLASAALFQPLRQRLQTFIDRRFYRRRYDAARSLAAFSATLRDDVDLTRLTEHIVGVAHETVQPASVTLWLRQPAATQRREDEA